MKNKITLLALLAGFTVTSFAQGPPAKVEEAFKAKFSGATSVEWDKENEKEWEAEFKIEGVKYSANFSNEGAWKETEHYITKEEIPAAVQKTLDTDFAGYEIKKAEISETNDGAKYEFKLVKGESKKYVVLAANGTLIK